MVDACVSTLVDVHANGYMSTHPANLVVMSEPGDQMGGIPVMSVSNVAQSMRTHINALPPVWIEGQLASCNVRNGHAYAKLKDVTEDATISVTVWRSVLESLPEQFAQGDKVRVLAKPDYWVAGGTLSFTAKDMRHEGLGDILEKIERLRRQLASEGLLDESRKKPLPFLPLCIGLITGANSDAEKDVLTNARLRWSDVQFRVVHTAVQGENCAPQVARAIAELDADPEIDVIIIARGGGDFLHLLPFSDELVVRAAATASTPIVSAIGHENDRPLLDEVADLRASTPTDAAKRVVPDVTQELANISSARSRITNAVGSKLRTETDHIAQLRSRPVMANPAVYLERHESDLRNYVHKGATLIDRVLERATAETAQLSAQMRALSPQHTLERGYSIVRGTDGAVISSVANVAVGDAFTVRVADGTIDATVAQTSPSNAR
ncbi:MAG: hypothetical protein RIS25_1038 [Actinomycetota bacterium]